MPCGADCPTCATLRRATIEATAAVGVAGVDTELLAYVAGVPVDAVIQHGRGSVPGWITSAYEESADRLQAEFESDFAAGSSWSDGLRRATDQLVSTLADDPARARFCYVEVLRGDQTLRARREAVRHRSVELFTRQYASRHGDSDLPHVKLELACNSIIHVIATHAREGRASELPDALDAMLLAAGAWEAQAFT